jgi:dipeptidase E
MPIVQPRWFEAIGPGPFQVSPHFQDPDPNLRHRGEIQAERVIQFVEETAISHVAASRWWVRGVWPNRGA